MSGRVRDDVSLRGRPLHDLERHGQSLWLSYLRRHLVRGGHLARLVEEAAISGARTDLETLLHAVAAGSEYAATITALRQNGDSPEKIIEELLIEDAAMAASVLRRAEGNESAGWVAVDLPDHLHGPGDEVVAWTERLRDAVDSGRFLLRVPSTPSGMRAAEAVLAAGHGVYVGQVYGLAQVEKVLDAYERGLGLCLASGNDLEDVRLVLAIHLVALDAVADEALRDRLRSGGENKDLLESLHGRAGIAVAKLATESVTELLERPVWDDLVTSGARAPWLAWEGTRTLSPSRRDVEYLEELIGPGTIAVVSRHALSAFQDHGDVRETLRRQTEAAEEVIDDFQAVGIDLDALADGLRTAAVERRERTLERLRTAIVAEPGGDESLREGALGPAMEEALGRASRMEIGRRLWERDPTLWEAGVEDPAAIRNRLGWLSLPEAMAQEALPVLSRRGGAEGGSAVVLMGMGGSSLGAEACRVAFGLRDFMVLDTTVPKGIASVASRASEGALYVVASKSGTTLETAALADYFYGRVAEDEEEAGKRFVAITDPGTPLHEQARRRRFQRIWLNPPDVGGRYSVLSYFGLVPMALMGLDVERVLTSAKSMATACGADVPDEENPGVRLGALLAAGMAEGRDKLTLLASGRLSGFADWIEQLVAESSGKGGAGLVPVSQEPLGEPDTYGDDRLFVQLRLRDEGVDDREEALLEEMAAAGAPVVRLELDNPHDLGREFFRWQVAIAVAGALAGFNPFDQPDVEAAKRRTREILADPDTFEEPSPAAESEALAVWGDPESDVELAERLGSANGPDAWIGAHLGRARPPDYVAIQAFLAPEMETWHALQGLRALLRDRLGVATSCGWGPRYLHSTGQLHKGGSREGVFLQLTGATASDLEIPGRSYTFGTLARAQAAGDLEALARDGRRVVRVHFRGTTEAGLASLLEIVGARLGS